MTTRIYYTDPYCRRFEAVVTGAVAHDSRPAALLDRTAFYPTSGGQPFDTGRFSPYGGADGPPPQPVEVLETIERDGEVVHVLSAPLAAGATVRGDIDWDRRFDHMQQHTGQHVLSAAFDRLFDNRTMSFHMGAETATIDLAREMSWDQMSRAEEEANRVVWEDREISIRFVDSRQLTDDRRGGSSDPPLQLRKETTREGVLRLIEVRDFDLSACGGTHVARTGSIGSIVVAGAEKFKGGTRLTFACGGRALRVVSTLRESVAGAVRSLSVLPRELPEAIERMQAEAKDLRRTIKKHQETLAIHEASRLVDRRAGPFGADDYPGLANAVYVVVEALDGWDSNGLKTIALAVTAATPAAVALFSTTSPYGVVVARSNGVTVDAHAVLRALTDRFGGRGGGKADLAQGGGLIGDIDDVLRAARSHIISDPS